MWTSTPCSAIRYTLFPSQNSLTWLSPSVVRWQLQRKGWARTSAASRAESAAIQNNKKRMKTSHMVNESTRNKQWDTHAEKRVWHLSQLRLARVSTHLSCTFWLREVHGGWGYSIVRQFAVPALSTRTNSFLLLPQQINTVLTSTQPVSQTSSSRQAGRQPGPGAALRFVQTLRKWDT